MERKTKNDPKGYLNYSTFADVGIAVRPTENKVLITGKKEEK